MNQEQKPSLVDRLTQTVMDWAVDIVRVQKTVQNWLLVLVIFVACSLIGTVALIVGLTFASAGLGILVSVIGIWGLIAGVGWKDAVRHWTASQQFAALEAERRRHAPLCNRNPIIFLSAKEIRTRDRNRNALGALWETSLGRRWLTAKKICDGPFSKEEIDELNAVAEDAGLIERFTFLRSQTKQSCKCEHCVAYRDRVYFNGAPIYNNGAPEPKNRQQYLDRIAEIDGHTMPPAPEFRLFGQPVDPKTAFAVAEAHS